VVFLVSMFLCMYNSSLVWCVVLKVPAVCGWVLYRMAGAVRALNASVAFSLKICSWRCAIITCGCGLVQTMLMHECGYTLAPVRCRVTAADLADVV
jgi:hypothetical protein